MYSSFSLLLRVCLQTAQGRVNQLALGGEGHGAPYHALRLAGLVHAAKANDTMSNKATSCETWAIAVGDW